MYFDKYTRDVSAPRFKSRLKDENKKRGQQWLFCQCDNQCEGNNTYVSVDLPLRQSSILEGLGH